MRARLRESEIFLCEKNKRLSVYFFWFCFLVAHSQVIETQVQWKEMEVVLFPAGKGASVVAV